MMCRNEWRVVVPGWRRGSVDHSAPEGLAPLIAREIWAIVRHIKAAGIATIIVDKNFAAVSAICDRVVIMVKGCVVFEGASSALRASPELHKQTLGV